MPSSSSLVERDDSDEGYLPRGQCEMLIAGAAYAISEGVYAFPQGSTEREWGSWVERMSAVAVRYDCLNLITYDILIYLIIERSFQAGETNSKGRQTCWSFIYSRYPLELHSASFQL